MYSNRALAKKKLIKEDEDGFRTKRHQDGIEDAGIWDMGEMGSALQPPIFEDEEGTWWGTLPIQWLVTPATSLPSEAADPYSTIKLLCPISRLEASFHLHSIAIYTQKSHFKHFCLCLY